MNNMSIGQLLSRFSGFVQNPGQMLQQMGLPADALKNPQATIQQLMNSGKMNQQQYTACSFRPTNPGCHPER